MTGLITRFALHATPSAFSMPRNQKAAFSFATAVFSAYRQVSSKTRLTEAKIEWLEGDALKKDENYSSAISHYQLALAIYQKEGRKLDIAFIQTRIGSCHYSENNNEEALKSYNEAKEIYEASPSSKENLAVVMMNIAHAKYKQESTKAEAIATYTQFVQENKDNEAMKKEVAACQFILGTNFLENNSKKEAIASFEDSLAKDSTGEYANQCRASLANAYIEDGQIEKAREQIKNARAQIEAEKNSSNVG